MNPEVRSELFKRELVVERWCHRLVCVHLVDYVTISRCTVMSERSQCATWISEYIINCSHRLCVDFCVVLFILFTVSLHVWQVWQNVIVMHRASTAHACPNSTIIPQCLHLFVIMIENNSQICVKIFIFTWLNRIWNIHIIDIWYTYIIFSPKCSWGVLLSCLDRFIKFWLSKKW